MKNKAQAQYNQKVFLEGVKLKGVTSVDGSYTHSVMPINVLGQGAIKTVIADVPQADFSISRNIAFADIFNPFTGVVERLRGSLNYGDKIFGFEDGYLSSYSYDVSYGDIPQTNIGIKVYGDIGSGMYLSNSSNPQFVGIDGTLNATGDYNDAEDIPIYPANIVLSCRNSSTNRVKSFSFSSNINYDVIYGVNSIKPIQVSIKYPIEVMVDFTLEVDDYETKRMTDMLVTGIADPFTIDVFGTVFEDQPIYTQTFTLNGPLLTPLEAGDGTPLLFNRKPSFNSNFVGPIPESSESYNYIKLFSFSYSPDTSKLVSEQVSASADDVTNVKLSYITYVNKTSQNSDIFFNQYKNDKIVYQSAAQAFEEQNK